MICNTDRCSKGFFVFISFLSFIFDITNDVQANTTSKNQRSRLRLVQWYSGSSINLIKLGFLITYADKTELKIIEIKSIK